MHQPKSIIPVPAFLAIGAIALTALVTSQVLSRKETQPAQASHNLAVTQSTVPVRAGAYIDDYAALNALREGVIVLPSGVQYEVLKTGKGRQPQEHDTVTVNYRAMLPTGVEFDNTYEQGSPTELQLDQYIVPGLKDALLHMKEGDEWRVTIPAKLAFGGGRLLRKRDLIYEITLLAITRNKAQDGTSQ